MKTDERRVAVDVNNDENDWFDLIQSIVPGNRIELRQFVFHFMFLAIRCVRRLQIQSRKKKERISAHT